ncbi:MAG: enoyl-CoA hydratase/isomerase family protein [Alphaproteobacteria bacterium]|nr:enoyl-CoA hydratase/isomerase family protein [Alphaproteobacteria bacterium]
MRAVPTVEEALAELRVLAQAVGAVPGAVRLDGDVLILDNPTAMGAVTVGMMAGLAEAVLELRAREGAVVEVRGSASGVFCSGGHLGQVRASLVEGGNGERMALCMTSVLDGLAGLPQVVVAMVDGPALGGGSELLTACDAVFVGDAARIGFVHTRLGVAPGWGGAARLVRAVGPRDALALLSSAAVQGPGEAVRTGLARGDLAAGEAYLARVRSAPAAAIRAVKRQVLAAAPLVRTGAEAALFAEVWGTPEHLARLGG